MYSPELQSKLALYRQKVANGTITDDELRESVELLRAERKTASQNAAAKRRTVSKPARDGNDLLAELEGL